MNCPCTTGAYVERSRIGLVFQTAGAVQLRRRSYARMSVFSSNNCGAFIGATKPTPLASVSQERSCHGGQDILYTRWPSCVCSTAERPQRCCWTIVTIRVSGYKRTDKRTSPSRKAALLQRTLKNWSVKLRGGVLLNGYLRDHRYQRVSDWNTDVLEVDSRS